GRHLRHAFPRGHVRPGLRDRRPAPYPTPARGVRARGRGRQEGRRAGRLSLPRLWLRWTFLRSDPQGDDPPAPAAHVRARRGGNPTLLPLPTAGRWEGAAAAVSDLGAPELALALARHVRLVHAQVPVEVPLPRDPPLVPDERFPRHRRLR